MTPLEQQIQELQSKLYWEKNAPLTCVVLTALVLLSSAYFPWTVRSFGAAAAGGVLLYLGSLASDRQRFLLALVLTLSAIAVAVWAILGRSTLRTSLAWVQSFAAFGVGMTGAMVFHAAIKDQVNV